MVSEYGLLTWLCFTVTQGTGQCRCPGLVEDQGGPPCYRAQSSVEDRTRMLMNQLGSWSLKLPQ